MSHDYDPNWDYPVCELSELVENAVLTESEKTRIESEVERIRKELAPAMGFPGVEVFFVEWQGLGLSSETIGNDGAMRDEIVAVYCSGTSSRPVIGIDLALTKGICADEGIDFLTQVRLSLAHELGHAYQESLGQSHEHPMGPGGFDEDEAETFGRNWADWGEIHLWLLDPELPRPSSTGSPSSPGLKTKETSQPDGAEGGEEELPEWLEKALADEVTDENPALWPRLLEGAREIADYIVLHAGDEVDHEFVEAYYRDSRAILVRLPVRRVLIDQARADSNIPDAEKDQRYLAMPAQTMPPIVIDEDCTVQDGHHRVRSAIERKDEFIWCYVSIDDRIDLNAIMDSTAKRKQHRP